MTSASKFMKELPPGWDELLKINYQAADFSSIPGQPVSFNSVFCSFWSHWRIGRLFFIQKRTAQGN